MPKQQLRQWYKIVTAKAADKPADDDAPTEADVLIYAEIDSWFGVSAQELVNDLNSLDVDQINVRINSPGGSAFDGIAIFNALKRHPANVTTFNDGLAASAASFIAQAGDERVTSKYGETMVHGASVIASGKADDLRSVADQIDRLNTNMATLYADSTGGDVDEWLAIMDAETWYTGDEAVKAGLYDRVDTPPAAAKNKGAAAAAASADGREFDLSRFKYAGRNAAPSPFTTPLTNAAAASSKEGTSMVTDEKVDGKVDGDADTKPDDDKVDASGDKADDTDTATPPAPPAVAAAAAKAGTTVVVDAAAFAALQEQARLGAAAHGTLQAQADAKVVDAALDKGKIPPSRREHYMAMMAADRVGTTTLLNETLQEAAIPLTEMGHASAANDGGPQASGTENPLYKDWMVV